MSDMNEENNKVWTTLESRTKLVTLFTQPGQSIFPRASSTTQEYLRVQDLDVLSGESRTPVRYRTKKALKVESLQSGERIKTAITSGNFTVYQGGDLNKFFGRDVFEPKCISEVCLVNDHFMLVKLPESQTVQPDRMVYDQKPSQSTSSRIIKTTRSTPDNRKSTTTKYCHSGYGRYRRVSPIPEAFEPAETSAKASWNSSGCMEEVFKSHTVITGKLNFRQPQNRPKQDPCSVPDDTKKTTETVDYNAPVAGNFRKPLQTSLANEVELEMHGQLETLGCENEEDETRNFSLPRPRGPFRLSLHWFLSSFRNRQTAEKSPKSALRKETAAPTATEAIPTITTPKQKMTKKKKTKKKKISAVVYKTYFVRWNNAKNLTKPKCQHCWENPLRRTRSALF